jgi:hypothetical protein
MGSENGSSKGNGSDSPPSPPSSTGIFPEELEKFLPFPKLYIVGRMNLMRRLSEAKGSQGIKDARLRSFLEREWLLFMQLVLSVSEKVLTPDEYSGLKNNFGELLAAMATGPSIVKAD